MDLVKKMLIYDPAKRISAFDVSPVRHHMPSGYNISNLNPFDQALHHRFFTTGIRPTAPIKLPKPSAELRPRPVAQEEIKGKTSMDDDQANGTAKSAKRKAADPDVGQGLSRNIARKLF
jgi:cyclin-dependent kinase 7